MVFADNQTPLAEFQGEPARLLVLLAVPDPVFLSLIAEFIANDKPILASYKGEILVPVMVDYPEEKFGGFLAQTDYKSSFIQDEINANGWMIWPPIRYSYQTVNSNIPHSAPTAPFWLMDEKDRCSAYPQGNADPGCTLGNLNWLGTDNQARDVTARMIYGFRISVLFGLTLTIASALVGVTAGAIQGYFGGWTDLLLQRFIEIWSSMPVLYILLIIAAILPPGFFVLLGIMLLFSWVGSVGIVRANSCAPETLNMSAPPAPLALATGRSCSGIFCPTPWWRR